MSLVHRRAVRALVGERFRVSEDAVDRLERHLEVEARAILEAAVAEIVEDGKVTISAGAVGRAMRNVK